MTTRERIERLLRAIGETGEFENATDGQAYQDWNDALDEAIKLGIGKESDYTCSVSLTPVGELIADILNDI